MSGKTFYQNDGTKTTGSYTPKSSWTKLGEAEYEVNTTSTTNTLLGTIQCGDALYTKNKMIYVRVRDKAGARNGYFLGSDTFFLNTNAANNDSGNFISAIRYIIRCNTNPFSNATSTGGDGYGIYGRTLKKNGDMDIYVRYQSTFSTTINGTYKVEVYSLDFPDGISPFNL